MNLKVAAIQLGPFKGDYGTQMDNIETLIAKVMEKDPVDIICLPELMTTPYFATTRDLSWKSSGELVPGGATFDRIAKVAQQEGCFIVATCVEQYRDKLYNSSFLVNPKGNLVTKYAKTHVPNVEHHANEKLFFEPGSTLEPVKIKGVSVAILICYDRSFPEAWRTLALKGADLVFVPTSSWGFRGDLYVEELKVAAAQHQLFVVGANKAGQEFLQGDEPKVFYGKSTIIDPLGNVISHLSDEEDCFITASLDMKLVEVARETVAYYKDRRLDLYKI